MRTSSSKIPRPGKAAQARPWWWDALATFAFWGQALFLGKAAARLSPFLGLLFFFANAGLGWLFARSAWRGLLDARDGGR